MAFSASDWMAGEGLKSEIENCVVCLVQIIEPDETVNLS